MKLIFIIILVLLVLCMNAFSSDSNENETDFESRINRLIVIEKVRIGVGAALIGLGSASLLSGITMSVFFQMNPADFPASIMLTGASTISSDDDVYLNPMILCLNLFGLAMLGVGIPLTIVGSVKLKKQKKRLQYSRVLKKIQPVLSYNLYNDRMQVGLRLAF